MSRLKLSRQAQYDLNRLYVFLGEKDFHAANNAMEAIDNGFKLLTKHPDLWAINEAGLREYLIEFGKNGYLALYDYDDISDIVEIRAIKHTLEDDYKWL
jgi:plasmid stabilization system protein ParE